MSVNKFALIRYKELEGCLCDKEAEYTIEDLLEKCNIAIKKEYPSSKGIKKRQLYEDIKNMKSEPFSAPIKVYYHQGDRRAFYSYKDKRYSIFSGSNLSFEEIQILKYGFQVLRMISGIPHIEEIETLLSKLNKSFAPDPNIKKRQIISVDENPYLMGMQHFSKLFEAIIRKVALSILYKPYDRDKSEFIIHPYFLKQYNNRWFLFGKNPEYNSLTNLPLDRIISINELEELSYIKTDINLEEYFENVVGVTIPETAEVQKIVLVADSSIAGYIETKPLHESQTPLRPYNGRYKFSIKVIPNPELESLILSFGEKIKVLSPLELQDKIKERLIASVEQY